MNDERDRIERAQRGDADAFGQLVVMYQDRLYSSLVHVVGSAEEAEDCVQEAFVQAYLKLATFHQESTFYTWLYRIAFNAAVTRQRRRRRAAVVFGAEADVTVQEPADPRDEPSQQLQQAETNQRVQQALATLDEEFRAVLILREMEGCDYETIAEILGISLGTVRSRLHRARARLREAWKKLEPRSRAE